MDAQQSTLVDHEIALENHQRLRAAGVFCVNFIGGPGCGKTSLISVTVRNLLLKRRAGIITADPFTHRDADRVSHLGDQVVQIDPGYNRMLDAAHVQGALRRLDLANLDLLLIENISSLIGPCGVDLGEDAKVCMFSVAAGDDKAAKYPDVVRCADLVLLNKVDLLSVMPFALEDFANDIQRLNPAVKLLPLSTQSGQGLDKWLEWLLERTDRASSTR